MIIEGPIHNLAVFPTNILQQNHVSLYEEEKINANSKGKSKKGKKQSEVMNSRKKKQLQKGELNADSLID